VSGVRERGERAVSDKQYGLFTVAQACRKSEMASSLKQLLVNHQTRRLEQSAHF